MKAEINVMVGFYQEKLNYTRHYTKQWSDSQQIPIYILILASYTSRSVY